MFSAIPYPGVTYQGPPDFTLYRDGHTIYKGSGQRELRHAQLTEAQIQQVITRAVEQGRLADARSEYGAIPGVYDMETTVFELDAGEGRRTVSGYALGWDDDTRPDPDIRRALEGLRIYLQRFDSVVHAGGATDLGAYQPEAYRAELVTPWWGEAEPNVAWPWPDLTAADFKLELEDHMLVRAVSPEQGEAVLELDIDNTVVARAPDGDEYLIRVRPLLPDQHP